MHVNHLTGGLASLGFREDPRIGFWKDQSHWPKDAGGYIFAARALLRLGKHLFPDSWSDDAPTHPFDAPLPERLALFTPVDEIQRGIRILQESDTAYSKRVGTGIGLLDPMTESPFPTTSEWDEAVRLDKTKRHQIWADFSPYLSAALALEKASLSGKLKSATRKQEGGAFVDQEWHFWNYEFAWSRFNLCRVNLDDPSGNSSTDDNSDWLYFNESSLQSYMDGPTPPNEPKQMDVSKAPVVRPRQSSVGRRPLYDWPSLAAIYRQYCDEGVFSEDTSTSEIADLLLDTVAGSWKKLPEKRSVEFKVREWREIRL